MDILEITKEAEIYSGYMKKALAKDNREINLADIEKAVCYGAIMILDAVNTAHIELRHKEE